MIATTVSAIPDLLGTSPADLIDRDADLPQVTADLARARATRIRAGLTSYTQMRQDIADAYAQRDWAALGYPSWFAYVEAEFSQALRGLTRDDRRDAAKDLRAQGMSQRGIAASLGVSKRTVENDLEQVAKSSHLPEAVRGADGKTYPASRPVSAPPAPSTLNGQALPPAAEPAAEPERPKPPKWDPEERRQHEAEVQRIQTIEAARRESKTIVTTVLAAVVTVVSGSRLGERGLVTADMIRELRKAIDLLEGELDHEE